MRSLGPGRSWRIATWRPTAAAAARTPREIVAELDKYVIGQKRAKKAVAIALRNRWRRQRLAPEMAREILPKNILMIGPTGVGKTEIARRLARLADAPFDLAPALVALVFLLYLFGTVSANWMGRLTDRRSRRSVLLRPAWPARSRRLLPSYR